MSLPPISDAGVFLCCLDHDPEDFPVSPAIGDVLYCKTCDDGLRWTGTLWQAAWLALPQASFPEEAA